MSYIINKKKCPPCPNWHYITNKQYVTGGHFGLKKCPPSAPQMPPVFPEVPVGGIGELCRHLSTVCAYANNRLRIGKQLFA